LLAATPALALLAGQGTVALLGQTSSVRVRVASKAVAFALLSALITASAAPLWVYYTAQTQFKADWRSVAAYIDQHAEPLDAVIIVAGHAMPAFDFYNTRHHPAYALPPRLLPTVSDPLNLSDVTETLNRVVHDGHNRVWLVLWQEPLADPRRLTLDLLFGHGQRLGITQNFHALDMLLFQLPPGVVFEAQRPQHALEATFGGQVQLAGYDLSSTSARAGDTLTLHLHWQAIQPIAMDYTVFAQLLDRNDKIVAQHDRRLGGDLYPVSRWPVGEPFREMYELAIASDTAPGHYRLMAGLYQPSAGPRLPVAGNDGASDHVLLAEIEIVP
jgi:hypothetical protein